jgi:hypothetical protein
LRKSRLRRKPEGFRQRRKGRMSRKGPQTG